MTQSMLVTPDAGSEQPLTELGPRLIDTTDFDGRFVVVHTLTTMIGVSPNRDFDGLPKRLLVGGDDRMRISAQCTGRAARTWARGYLNESGQATRSRRLPERVATILVDTYNHDPAEAGFTAAAIIAATGMGIDWDRPQLTTAVMYLRADTPERMARLAHDHWTELSEARTAVEQKLNSQLAKSSAKRGKKKTAAAEESELTLDGAPASGGSEAEAPPTEESGSQDKVVKPTMLSAELRAQALAVYDVVGNIEVATWGRMLANIPQLNMDSAVQVAHQFAVDPLRDLVDDFTVVDDLQTDEVFGAANQGQHVLASGTLYGYYALDRQVLRDNLRLGNDAPEQVETLARTAEQVFVSSVCWSTPSGKQSRTGSSAPPNMVIAATTDVALTAAATFEHSLATPASVTSAHRLVDYLRRAQRMFPFHGGLVWWLSPEGSELPELPANLRLLD